MKKVQAFPLVILVILVMLVALLGGCSRSPAPPAESKPVPITVPPELSFVNTGDVRSKPQLLSGWYNIEDGAWRWMAKEAQAALLVPREAPVNFELHLFFPPDHMKKAGGPVQVSVLLDGNLFDQQTYAQPGAYALVKPVPPGIFSSPVVRLTIRLDRAAPPSDADRRELGAVVQSFGFQK